MSHDWSSLSPRDIGRGLAISLDTSCKIEDISDNERSLLRDAKLPIERYHQELLLLAGFAHDYAIYKLVGQTEIGKQILAGYREAWQNVAKAGPTGAALFQLFLKRCSEYSKAAEENEQSAKQEAKSISRIALIFGGFINPENGTSADRGSAQMLALTYADNCYFSHSEGTVEALRAAKVLR